MRKIWTKITGLALLATLVFPAMVEAAGPAAAPLVIVADTRKFTGWEAWWTNLYNESHFWFAVVTVVLIPVVGVLLGILADLVMSRIGIDLSSRDLAEH
jgi:hypothetical protein